MRRRHGVQYHVAQLPDVIAKVEEKMSGIDAIRGECRQRAEFEPVAVGFGIIEKAQEDIVVIAAKRIAVEALGRRRAEMREHIAGARAAIDIIAEVHQELSAGKIAGVHNDAPFGRHHLIIAAVDVAERIDRGITASGEINAVSLLLHGIRRFLPGRASTARQSNRLNGIEKPAFDEPITNGIPSIELLQVLRAPALV